MLSLRFPGRTRALFVVDAVEELSLTELFNNLNIGQWNSQELLNGTASRPWILLTSRM